MRAREVGLGHNPNEAATRDHRGAVEDTSGDADGQPHRHQHVSTGRNQVRQRPLGGIQQIRLVEEIRAGIARQTQLGEDDSLSALRSGIA